MKVEQEEGFRPVVITLETLEDLNRMVTLVSLGIEKASLVKNQDFGRDLVEKLRGSA